MWLRGLGDGGVSVDYDCLSARTLSQTLFWDLGYGSACLLSTEEALTLDF